MIREWVIIVSVLVATVIAATHFQVLWRVDQTLYDSALGLLERPASDDIVIVGIDDDSLAQIGRWPWPRSVHPYLLDRLARAKPKVVVFDVILSEPDRTVPANDEKLADAIKRNGKVVLPVIFRQEADGMIGEARPTPLLLAGAAGLGHISANLDPDGMLRSVFLKSGVGFPRHDAFALSALRLAEPEAWPRSRKLPGESVETVVGATRSMAQAHRFSIPFVGPPGHFRRIPYVEAIAGELPDSVFSGKYVLVGATASSMTDEFPTPVSGRLRAMPGIEVQANILQALREGATIRHATPAASMIAGSATLILVMLSFLWVTPRVALVGAVSAAALALVAAALLFRFGLLWWSPSVTFLVLMMSYPLWSWRKLEATQRFFDAELERFAGEPSLVPLEVERAIAPVAAARRLAPGVIERRIASVKEATERLRSLNRFIADSMESLPDATLVTNQDGKILLANSSADALFKARRTRPTSAAGRAPDQPLEGRDVISLLDRFHVASGGTWRERWVDAYEDTRKVSFEAKDDAGRETLIQIAPLFSIRGPQIGSIVCFVDIAPLRESERRRDEALRFLSHDMRSPQASILTLLSMYTDDPESMPIGRLTERIERYARRTLNLADDFLRLAKAERSRADSFEVLELGEILRDAVDEAWSLAGKKSIRLTADDVEGALIRGDRDLLTRALINLLSNAIKYSPPQTAIRVTATRVDGRWEVAVADQGYGIAAEDMTRLFTRFSRLKQEGQPEEEGIGLGLVFVKTVVERHGGTIQVESIAKSLDSQRHGTTFTVSLPAAEPDAPSNAPKAP
ncbi:MAG TPA: CHASE2 domain-containing protein [Usitatibacteraceae bacterium]|nr:CHASE2 domain-containing protein [Usitatibacteraceae bacterium]